MKLIQLGLVSVTVTAAAILATQAQAQASPSPLLLTGPTPAGVCSLNVNRALTESTAGRYVLSRLNELGAAAQAELQATASSLQADGQAFDAKKATLTPQQYQTQGEALQSRAQAFQQTRQVRQRELQDTRDKAFQTIEVQLAPIVQQTAVQRHCTLLLNSEALILPNPSIDITDSAMATLNVKLTQFPIEREHLDQGAPAAR